MTGTRSARPARRRHRRHVRPRPRAGPRAARPRRAASPSSPATATTSSGSPRARPAPTASSATSRGRKTFIRSRSRCSAPSAASTCSSTMPRRSGRCRSSRSPTPNARISSWRSRPIVLGPFRLTKALLGSLAASAREGGIRWWSTSRATPPSTRTRTGAPTARARRRCSISAASGTRSSPSEGIRVVSIDPGDMDTPLHALAVPDADRSTLKRPETRRARDRRPDRCAIARSAARPRRPMIPPTCPRERRAPRRRRRGPHFASRASRVPRFSCAAAIL